MTSLVAILSTGKGTWAEVIKIIENEDWEKIFLITNDFGKEKFTSKKEINFILINNLGEIDEMTESIIKELKGKISGTEVGLSMVSGSGKEHIAVITSLMKLGLGFRLLTFKNNKVIEA